MKALVVYDSTYGNTEKVARAIYDSLSADSRLLQAAEATTGDLADADLLIVGSPTQGGRPTAAVKELLARVPAGALDGKAAAAFDTRLSAGDSALPLRLLLNIFGYAAGRIAGQLKARGARLLVAPEGFLVAGKEGPLLEGEVERARGWASRLSITTRT